MKTQTVQSQKPIRFVMVSSACVFAFFAFLMWCAPYSSDDLEFASLDCSTVREYIRFALYYGNGRFLGNLCAIALSNSKLLCVLVKAIVLSSTVFLAPTVLGLQDKRFYLMSFLLIVAMEPNVFGEALTWTSGFSNYVMPIWLTLIIVLLLQQYATSNLPTKVLSWLAVPLLGLASQLFIEHSSGVNCLLAFCFLIYYFRKGEKGTAVLCGIWLISTTIGLGLMFVIPKIFFREGNRVDGYRASHLQSLSTIVIACIKNAVHLTSYYFGACEVPLCFGAITTVMKTRQKRSETPNRVLLCLAGAAAVYMGLGTLLSLSGYLGKSAMFQHVLAGGSVFIPFGVWVFAACQLEPQQRRSQLFLLGFALVSLIPLLVVTPTPPRVILQSYAFIVLAALQCFSWISWGQSKQTEALLCTVCLSLAVLLSSVFFSIRNMAAVRDAHIQQELANNASEIEIFILPYEYTTWDHLWSQGYIYEDTDNVTFITVDFYTWMNSYYE